MQLTPLQMDALTELMNVATGRAAASLANILRQYIKTSVLEIRIMNQSEIRAFLEDEIGEIGSVIEQRFSGGMEGDSLLVMARSDASTLVQTLLQQNHELSYLTNTEHTVLAEVGNIVLNACVAMFANQTGRRLHFGLPQVALDVRGEQLADDLASQFQAHIEGLVMKSHLIVGQLEAIIYVLILLTMDQGTIQAIIDEALSGAA